MTIKLYAFNFPTSRSRPRGWENFPFDLGEVFLEDISYLERKLRRSPRQ